MRKHQGATMLMRNSNPSAGTGYILGLVSAVSAALIFLTGYDAKAIEEASYRVQDKSGNLELRYYPPQLVAETYVEGNFEAVGNEGFRRLAAYIGGKNRKKTAVAMTTPVTQESESQEIEMTAPVTQQPIGNRWRITFLMPSGYSLETLPLPDDDRVTITIHQIA